MKTNKINVEIVEYPDRPNNWKELFDKDFDEIFVLSGNRDMHDEAKASWYKNVETVIRCYFTLMGSNEPTVEEYDDILRYELDYVQYLDVIGRIKVNVESLNTYLNHSNGVCKIIDIVKILYPELKVESFQISGSVQREWQTVYYRTDLKEITKEKLYELADWYFGYCKLLKITGNLNGESISCNKYITSIHLDDLDDKSELTSAVYDALGLDSESSVEIHYFKKKQIISYVWDEV